MEEQEKVAAEQSVPQEEVAPAAPVTDSPDVEDDNSADTPAAE